MAAQEIIPSNIAKSTDVDELRKLNDMLLYFTTAILDKLPRLDVNDRALVTVEGGGTLSTVSTVSNVSNITAVGGQTASLQSFNFANMGAAHLYANIVVS